MAGKSEVKKSQPSSTNGAVLQPKAAATKAKVADTKPVPKSADKNVKSTPFAHKTSAPAMQPELRPTRQEQKPSVAVAPPVPPAPPAPMVKPFSSAGKRDPFVNPVHVAVEGTGACSGGKRCLMISQITLRGIVKSLNGWIAVVENPGQKTYFLHENDPVLNGFVSRITGETVVFKENVTDTLGHQTQREIVKHVSAPVV
jgi:Tfp pilus assembly protein PilP